MSDQIKILGNKIDCFPDIQTLFSQILSDQKASTCKGYVTVNNVHTMMEGYWDESFRKIINESYLSIPDGKPLEVVGKLKGNKKISRLFGPTVMERFIDGGRKEGISHFFIGSSEESLQKLCTAINAKYPGTKISGMIAPPFKPVNEWDNESFIRTINEAAPDFIWVGLGAPKQERWMYDNFRQIDKGILFGIGAGFDYLAGNTRHAPNWMKNASLEWLFRLVQEPRRLWKRYFRTIPPFIVLASLELMGLKLKSAK
jgi:N-acetylglucosaminyldiphosphoundecaprenol N-acetyl-beta-D-mannosaminyltransferase